MTDPGRNEPDFDADEILDGIRDWVLTESPTVDTGGVNTMMDKAEQVMARLGAEIERVPGVDGYGDIVIAHVKGQQEGPGVLVLGHLDTVHMVGTLEAELAFRREGDRVYGPGIYDMKGGMFTACYALRQVLRSGEAPVLPVTFMFISDEEVGSPSKPTADRRRGVAAQIRAGARTGEGRDRYAGDRTFRVFAFYGDRARPAQPCGFPIGQGAQRDC